MTGRLADHVAVITGAAAGTGRATALRFAEEGAHVVLADVDGEGGEQTARLVQDAGGQAVFVCCDITDPDGVQGLFDTVRTRFGRLDVLINCAGGSTLRDTLVTELELDELSRAIALNLTSVVLCCRAGLPLMRERGGSVVNVSSAVAIRAGIWPSDAYTTAKAGVLGLTRSIAANYAQFGIRANAVCPAMVRSERVVKASLGSAGVLDTGDIEPLVVDFARYPFAVGDPIDMANILLFLASPESKMITGAVIPADGGMSSY